MERQKNQLIQFLQNELIIPASNVELALRHADQTTDLPILLWQYGFVSLPQLNRIFDWMEEFCW